MRRPHTRGRVCHTDGARANALRSIVSAAAVDTRRAVMLESGRIGGWRNGSAKDFGSLGCRFEPCPASHAGSTPPTQQMPYQDDTAAAILAAGLGTRMGSDLPKALLPLGDQCIVQHVVSSVLGAGITRVVVIVGRRGELVRQALGNHVSYAVQESQLGTAHALSCAREALRDFDGYLVTLYCDVPFVPPGLLQRLVRECAEHDAAAAMVTVELQEPDAYGRIIRAADGRVVGIKEAAGATADELAIKEINAGVYCFRAPLIFDIAAEIKPDPVKGEYYLTDAIGILAAGGHRIVVVKADDPAVVMGVNTPGEWEQAQRALRRRCANGGSG